MMLMSHSDFKAARVAFEAARSADPHFLDADLSLAQVDVVEGKMDNARALLNAVLTADSGNRTASLWLAKLDAIQGRNDAALARFRQAVATDPNNIHALNDLAYLLADYRHQPDEALKYAQKAVELAPDDPNLLDTLGWVLYQKGLYPSAIQYLERARSGKGKLVCQYHLAMAYAKAGDTARGRSALEAALKVNPNLPEAKAAERMLANPN